MMIDSYCYRVKVRCQRHLNGFYWAHPGLPINQAFEMRKSKRETEETRKRIVEMAADEFRQHGIATSGIADLMAAVGLTHGGFYRHFESKEQLVAEATAAALDTLLDTLASAASGKKGRNGLKAVSAAYVCTEHRDNSRDSCPLAALGSELTSSDI